jgi:hypothetical protein
MMEAVSTSETSVDNYFTRQYIPEDNSELNNKKFLGRTNSPAFPTCHLFEVLEPNLMEINLSEFTLTSFN